LDNVNNALDVVTLPLIRGATGVGFASARANKRAGAAAASSASESRGEAPALLLLLLRLVSCAILPLLVVSCVFACAGCL
jgi:hypothetical protein